MRGVLKLAESAHLRAVSRSVYVLRATLPPMRPANACRSFRRKSAVAPELHHLREAAAAS